MTPNRSEQPSQPPMTPAEAQVFMEGYTAAQLGHSPDICDRDHRNPEFILWMRGYVEGFKPTSKL